MIRDVGEYFGNVTVFVPVNIIMTLLETIHYEK